jgi:hypothetical protein
VFGVTKFFDLTDEEFEALHLTNLQMENPPTYLDYIVKNPPTSVNWVE